MKVTKQDIKEFKEIIKEMEENETVQKLRDFVQHCNTTRYDHCREVAFYSYLLCKKYGLDYKAAARAGMLHDLFFYDWHDSKKKLNLEHCHAIEHPRIALKNAKSLFLLNKKEQDIIAKHMWPVTFALPRYKESFIITFVDKYCATKESLSYFLEKIHLREMYRFGYVLLSMLIIRF